MLRAGVPLIPLVCIPGSVHTMSSKCLSVAVSSLRHLSKHVAPSVTSKLTQCVSQCRGVCGVRVCLCVFGIVLCVVLLWLMVPLCGCVRSQDAVTAIELALADGAAEGMSSLAG